MEAGDLLRPGTGDHLPAVGEPGARADLATAEPANWDDAAVATRPLAVRYGVAVVLVLLAGLVTWAVRPWLGGTVTPAFFAAVALGAWFGGLGPGLAATLLSLLVLDTVFFSVPGRNIAVGPADLPRLVAFVVVAVLISHLSASREQTALALRASEQRFRSLFETAGEGIWIIDREGGTRFANGRLAALLGVAPTALTATTPAAVVAPADAPRLRAGLERALVGDNDTFDVRLRRGDGGEAVASVGISPVRDGRGRIVGALLMIADVSERVRIEQELERVNERFVLAAEAAQEMIYDWDLATDRVDRSPALVHIVGFRPEEVPPTGTWWRQRLHPDDLQSLGDPPGGDGPEHFSHEYRVLHRDGTWRTVRDAGRVLRDGEGHCVRLVGSMIDVTEQRAAEAGLALLAEAAETLAVALGEAGLVERIAGLAVPRLADRCLIDLVDADGRIVAGPVVSTAAAQALPLWRPSPDQVHAGRVVLEPDLRQGTRALPPAAAAALRDQGVVSVLVAPLEARARQLGAMTLLSLDPHRRYGEREWGLAAHLARRSALALDNARLYREVQAAEARYRGLFEGAKDGIIVFDRTGRIVEANAAFCAMVGLPEDRVLERTLADLTTIRPGDDGQALPSLLAAGEWRGEIELVTAADGRVPTEASFTAVALPTATVYVGGLRDVSERRALERMQEEFLSSVAHDLKNPLAVIQGQAQLLRRRLAKGGPLEAERMLAGLGGIDQGAQRMEALIDELVDLARLRGGQPLELRRQPIDLVELTRRAVEDAQRNTERHALRFAPAAPTLVALVDGPRLERVLANLLGNAIKYSPAGGEIAVRLRAERADGRTEAVLEVEDRGVGIPAADLPVVFDRFRRGRNVGMIGGAGIGLAGARSIVEGHGGTIAVRSVEGQGSTFTVRLPLDAG